MVSVLIFNQFEISWGNLSQEAYLRLGSAADVLNSLLDDPTAIRVEGKFNHFAL